MSPSIVAVIPTVGRGPLLREVIISVMNDVRHVAIYDNWPADQPRPWPGVPSIVQNLHEYHRCPDVSLYEVWNRAVAHAVQAFPPQPYVVFLNDDIEPPAGLVRTLAQLLDAHPDVGLLSVDVSQPQPSVGEVRVEVVAGTHRHGGFEGHAFIARSKAWPIVGIDPGYRIWYGDDDLVDKVRRSGWKVAVARGVHCRHEESSTVNAWPDRDVVITADRARWSASGRGAP